MNRVKDLARGIILTGFSEFIYDIVPVVYPSKQVPENCIFDWYVLGKTSNFTTDIVYTINDLRHELPNVDTIILWIDWYFAANSSDKSFDPSRPLYPYVSLNVKNYADINQWNVAGMTKDDAPVLPYEHLGGTPNDMALVRCTQYLKSLGYKVGWLPIQRDVNNIWRGEIIFRDSNAFSVWCDGVVRQAKHYIDLAYNNGIQLDYFCISSELQTSYLYDPPNYPFQDVLLEIAMYCKQRLPNTKTYNAPNWDMWAVHYYNGDTFPLDRLYRSPYLDIIALDFYFSINTDADYRTITYNRLLSGFTSLADWDWYFVSYGSGGQTIDTSLKNNKFVNPITSPITNPLYRKKDLRTAKTLLGYNKPIWLGELGYATLTGTTLTPNVFPDFLDLKTVPWNSDMTRNENEYRLALNVALNYFASQLSDVVEKVLIYCYDARPRATWETRYEGTKFYYRDRQNLNTGMPLNGKLFNQLRVKKGIIY